MFSKIENDATLSNSMSLNAWLALQLKSLNSNEMSGASINLKRTPLADLNCNVEPDNLFDLHFASQPTQTFDDPVTKPFKSGDPATYAKVPICNLDYLPAPVSQELFLIDRAILIFS